MQPRARRSHAAAPAIDRVEWPTVCVALAIYLGLGLLTWFHASIPVWLLPLLGGYFVCWHGSLQHEVVHGHPTPWTQLNRAMVALPVALWMPFSRYRETHLAHHRTEAITAPGCDPESFYCTRAQWHAMPRLRRILLSANNTLIGRLTLGPLLTIASFLRSEWKTLGEPGRKAVWLRHCAGVTIVLCWVTLVCGMPLWLYLLAFAWPGLSLTLLRSFHEHQPAAIAADRTNSLRAPLWLRLLYLNNNYHGAHHRRPDLSWYELPRLHGNRRWDGSYAQLFAHFWQRKDSPAHPLGDCPTSTTM